VMTERARHFVGELTFQALSGRPVFTDLFDRGQEAEIGHIRVADQADLVVVAPATASTMARLAAGLADDALSAVVLASRAPLLLAPSMNVNMWDNPITQRNLNALVELREAMTVGPGSGFLACNWVGPGRMAEPEEIAFAAECVLADNDLATKRVVITSGPTREAVDPVRFLSNRSSGRMGTELARAAVMRGASVVLVSGPTEQPAVPGVEQVDVTSAHDMMVATREAARGCDALVLAAAVADYRPARVAEGKLKKANWGDRPSIELERTDDILAQLGAERQGRHPVIVGFAAETGDPTAAAQAKLQAKKCDLIVGNDVSRADAGFASDQSAAVLVSAAGGEDLGRLSKAALAHRIWDRVAGLLSEGR
ncbi:MAG: bifunctional phosphopantothenoylcysteine decarboxylase/phosphopantothenate--cysteine ligase CoaBC, partial [Deltaproteobacteria bacterium]|nr:bifunctional phosphopantothenoylcysteine decarboxylase/phosphopantothenate--cysteine ligase CoaBC [Deltaproteobacteria bacterium]